MYSKETEEWLRKAAEEEEREATQRWKEQQVEEAAEKYATSKVPNGQATIWEYYKDAFLEGVKWQQEHS